ncbi:MAG: hypothetical protein ACLTKG_00020 [Collinsella intestinalis]
MNYGGDEKAFVETIEQVGFTKDTYLENKILGYDSYGRPRKKPSDEEIITYLNENLSTQRRRRLAHPVQGRRGRHR